MIFIVTKLAVRAKNLDFVHQTSRVEGAVSLALTLPVTEEVSLEIRYRVVKRAATLATGPRTQKLAADRDS